MNEVWIVTYTDDDGSDAICTIVIDGQLQPLIGIDGSQLPDLMMLAQKIALDLGRVTKIVKFSGREEVQAFSPILTAQNEQQAGERILNLMKKT